MTEPSGGLAITFDRDSIVNERTGTVSGPSEYVENLRALERTITRGDEDIESLKARLKMAREAREEAVAALRSAIREGKVLPLLEADDGDTDTAQPKGQPMPKPIPDPVPDQTLPGDLPDRPDHPSIPTRPDRPDHPDRPGRPDRPDQELPDAPDPK